MRLRGPQYQELIRKLDALRNNKTTYEEFMLSLTDNEAVVIAILKDAIKRGII